MPVGTDHMMAEVVATRAAESLAQRLPVVVAPVVPVGHSHHHIPFGGTLSVTPATYQLLLSELCLSAAESGFRRIFILNGHGGNVAIAATAAREASRVSGIPIGSGSYWSMAWQRLIAIGAEREGELPGHSGMFETSLMLALRPDLVKEDRPHRQWVPADGGVAAQASYDAAIPGQWERMEGWTDDPSRASGAVGQRYLAAIIEGVVEELGRFCDEADQAWDDPRAK